MPQDKTKSTGAKLFLEENISVKGITKLIKHISGELSKNDKIAQEEMQSQLNTPSNQDPTYTDLQTIHQQYFEGNGDFVPVHRSALGGYYGGQSGGIKSYNEEVEERRQAFERDLINSNQYSAEDMQYLTFRFVRTSTSATTLDFGGFFEIDDSRLPDYNEKEFNDLPDSISTLADSYGSDETNNIYDTIRWNHYKGEWEIGYKLSEGMSLSKIKEINDWLKTQFHIIHYPKGNYPEDTEYENSSTYQAIDANVIDLENYLNTLQENFKFESDGDIVPRKQTTPQHSSIPEVPLPSYLTFGNPTYKFLSNGFSIKFKVNKNVRIEGSDEFDPDDDTVLWVNLGLPDIKDGWVYMTLNNTVSSTFCDEGGGVYPGHILTGHPGSKHESFEECEAKASEHSDGLGGHWQPFFLTEGDHGAHGWDQIQTNTLRIQNPLWKFTTDNNYIDAVYTQQLSSASQISILLKNGVEPSSHQVSFDPISKDFTILISTKMTEEQIADIKKKSGNKNKYTYIQNSGIEEYFPSKLQKLYYAFLIKKAQFSPEDWNAWVDDIYISGQLEIFDESGEIKLLTWRRELGDLPKNIRKKVITSTVPIRPTSTLSQEDHTKLLESESLAVESELGEITRTVNLRAAATTASKILGRLSKNMIVKILAVEEFGESVIIAGKKKGTKWYKVLLRKEFNIISSFAHNLFQDLKEVEIKPPLEDGSIGWVYSDFLFELPAIPTEEGQIEVYKEVQEQAKHKVDKINEGLAIVVAKDDSGERLGITDQEVEKILTEGNTPVGEKVRLDHEDKGKIAAELAVLRNVAYAEANGILYIGDLQFSLPPTSMQFSWINQSSVIPTLRTEGDAVLSHNNHIPRVNITLYFSDTKRINEELRPLIAMYKYMPFSTVQNVTIFDSWVSRQSLSVEPDAEDINRFQPISCYLENITFSTIPGFPNSIQATLSIVSASKAPYSLSNRLYRHWKDAEDAAKKEATKYALDSSIIAASAYKGIKPNDMDGYTQETRIDSVGSKATMRHYNTAYKAMNSFTDDKKNLNHAEPDKAPFYDTTLYPQLSEPFKKQYRYKLSEEPHQNGNIKVNFEDGTVFWPKYKAKDNKSLYLVYRAPKKFDTPYTIFADRLSVLNDVARRVQNLSWSLLADPVFAKDFNPDTEDTKDKPSSMLLEFELKDVWDNYIEWMGNMYAGTQVVHIINKMWDKILKDLTANFFSSTTTITYENLISGEGGQAGEIIINNINVLGDFDRYDYEKGEVVNDLAIAFTLMWERSIEAIRELEANDPPRSEEDRKIMISEIENFLSPLMAIFKEDSPEDLFPEKPSSPINYNNVAVEFGWNKSLTLLDDQDVSLHDLVNKNTHKSIDGNIVGYHAPSIIDSITYNFSNNSIPNFLVSSNLPVYQHMGIPSASASIILRTRDERIHKLLTDMSEATRAIGAQLLSGNYKLAPFAAATITGNLSSSSTASGGGLSGHLLNSIGFFNANIRNVNSRNIEGHPGWWEISLDLIENTQNIRILEQLHNTDITSMPSDIEELMQYFFPAHLVRKAMLTEDDLSYMHTYTSPDFGMSADERRNWMTRVPNMQSNYSTPPPPQTRRVNRKKKDFILQPNEDIIIRTPPYMLEEGASIPNYNEISEISIQVEYGIARERKEKYIKNILKDVLEHLNNTVLKELQSWESDKRKDDEWARKYPPEFSLTETVAWYIQEFLSQLIYTLRDMEMETDPNTISIEFLSQEQLNFSFPNALERKSIDFSGETFYLQALFLDTLTRGFMYTLIRRQDFREFLDDKNISLKTIYTMKRIQLDQAYKAAQKVTEIAEGNPLLRLGVTVARANEKKAKEELSAAGTWEALSKNYINKKEWIKFISSLSKSIGSNFPDLNLPNSTLEGTGHRYISPSFPFVDDNSYLEIKEMALMVSGIKLQTLYGLAALRAEEHRDRYQELMNVLYKDVDGFSPFESDDSSADYFEKIWGGNAVDTVFDRTLIGKLEQYGIDVNHKMSAFIRPDQDSDALHEDGEYIGPKVSLTFFHRYGKMFAQKYADLEAKGTIKNLKSSVSQKDLMRLMAGTAIMEFLVTLATANLHLSNSMPKILKLKEENQRLLHEAARLRNKMNVGDQDISFSGGTASRSPQMQTRQDYDEVVEEIKLIRKQITEESLTAVDSGAIGILNSQMTQDTMTKTVKLSYQSDQTARQAWGGIEVTEDNDLTAGTFMAENFMDLINQKLSMAVAMNNLAQTGHWPSFTEFLGLGNIESEERKFDLLTKFNETLNTKRSGHMSKAFPTFKIFFIEEDNNVWHAFDDFYSYDAVHEISIVESKHAASKTAVIKLSNVTGNLLKAEWEGLFNERDQWGPIPNQAMRIKVGAQLMILVGYGADYRHLRMKFKGAVTEINPGAILELTAQSWGAGLLNKVGSTNVISYHSLSGATSLGSAVYDILAQTPGLSKLGRFTIRPREHNDPTRIASTTFKNIYYARALNSLTGTLGDFIPIDTNVGNIIGGYNSKGGLPYTADLAGEAYRQKDSVISLVGNSLYDNIIINTSSSDGYGFFNWFEKGINFIQEAVQGDWATQGFNWHVVRQSSWDSLHEISLFLGDYIVTTLPYDEGADLFSQIPRETLYFGPREGFYKAKSKIPPINISFFLDELKEKIEGVNPLLDKFRNTAGVLVTGDLKVSPISGSEYPATGKIGGGTDSNKEYLFYSDAYTVDPELVDLLNPDLTTSDEHPGAVVLQELLQIGKHMLSEVLDKPGIRDDALNPAVDVDTDGVWATASINSRMFRNFKETLVLPHNNFWRTFSNITRAYHMDTETKNGKIKIVYPKWLESENEYRKAPGASEVLYTAAGAIWIGAKVVSAATVTGDLTNLNPWVFGAKVGGVALGAYFLNELSGDFIDDVAAGDSGYGKYDLITHGMPDEVIREILLNDFDHKYPGTTAKAYWHYNAADQIAINKLEHGLIHPNDIAIYNTNKKDPNSFRNRHKLSKITSTKGDDTYRSALWYILADPNGWHSVPQFQMKGLLVQETSEAQLTMDKYILMEKGGTIHAWDEPMTTDAIERGGQFFWKIYGTYFSKQDIAILLDTVDYFERYYRDTNEGVSGEDFFTQPGALELDKALMKVYGDRIGGQRSIAERSVIQQHSVNNYQDIIDNSIIATSDQMYNHVELLYPSGPDPDNNPSAAENKAFAYYSYDQDPDFLRSYQTYQKNLDPNIFLDKTAADNYLHISEVGVDPANKKYSDEMQLTPHRVANQILMNVMRPMYQGTLTILGDPNIRPWDIVHIHDDMTEMYGPIEVEQVVTTISPTSGYTTTIVPNALIYHNNFGVTLDRNLLLLTQQMKTLLTIWTTIKWALTGVATGIAWRSLKVLGTNRITKVNSSIKSVDKIFGKKAREFVRNSSILTNVGKRKLAKDFLKDLTKKERKILQKHMTSAEIADLETILAQGKHDMSMGGRKPGQKILAHLRKNRVTVVNGVRKTVKVKQNHAWRLKAQRRVGYFIEELKVEYKNNPAFWKKPAIKNVLAEKTKFDTMMAKYDLLGQKLDGQIADKNGRYKKLSGAARTAAVKTRRKLATKMNDLITDGSEKMKKVKVNGKWTLKAVGRNTSMGKSLLKVGDQGRLIASRNYHKRVNIYKKSLLAGITRTGDMARFGLKALNWIGWGLTIYEFGSWIWDSYKLSAKTSILQANLLAGSNQLTIIPLEHPAGKDYVAGLEGVIGTAAGSSQILWGFTSGSTINRSIRTQDMVLQNMMAATD